MSKTFLGSTAITCAAVDDVTAWSIMAFVVGIVMRTMLVIMALVTTVLTGPLLTWFGQRDNQRGGKGVIAMKEWKPPWSGAVSAANG